MPRPRPNRRMTLYLALNAAFMLTVFLLSGIGGGANPRILYLISLFAVCSAPVIDLDGLNGKYVLPSLYLAFYFVSFGLLDMSNLTKGVSSEITDSIFSATEAVILVGSIMMTIGYRAAMALSSSKASPVSPARDWSMNAILIIGVSLWFIGTVGTYYLNVYLISDNSPEAAKRGLETMGPYGTTAFMLATMIQPIGILLLAYAWRRRRSLFLLALVITVVIVQVLLGFVINVKSMAMIGGILVILTFILIEGRLPIPWLIAAVLYGLLIYPIFVAARAEIHGKGMISRASILGDLEHVVELAIAAENRDKNRGEHAQSLLERTSVRASVQMIVEHTGVDVKFQNGSTLTPLLATFIPKIIWSDKPAVATGRVVNTEFHVTEADFSDTYISPSIPGELYWNFGWPGILIGMAAIGVAIGYLGQRCNLAERRNVTNLIVIVVTIKQVIVGMEGTFSPEYVVWLRSLGAVGILHLMFARVPISGRSSISNERPALPAHAQLSQPQPRPFSNILS
jgi:hypothetical protein